MSYLERGMSKEDGVNLILNGFCKRVFREPTRQFAVEARRRPNVSLKGSVG